jgi:glycosyltransferase involved in cell wall biosynthesis
MKCGTLGFLSDGIYDTPNGQLFGANVAEKSLRDATLAFDEDLIWEILSVTASEGSNRAIRLFEDEYPVLNNRLRTRDIHALGSLPGDDEYVLVTSLPFFSRIGDLRRQAKWSNVPTCTLVHSLWTANVQMTAMAYLLHMRPCDVIVASSSAARQVLDVKFEDAINWLSEHHSFQARGAPLQPRIVQIPFGVTVPLESALDRTAARRLFQIPEKAFVALYLGRLSEEYKADLSPLIIAVRHLASSGVDIRLILAGQSSEHAYCTKLRAMSRAAGLGDRVIYIENFPEFLKSSLYAVADVCVSPVDSIQETFGLSVLEAMAHARPVIASDWSGYRDLIENGTTGILLTTFWSSAAGESASRFAPITTPTATANYLAQHTVVDVAEMLQGLRLLESNGDLRKQMGNAGRQRVQAFFSWPNVAKRFLQLWHDQIAEGMSTVPEQEYPFSLNAVFSHYASHHISSTTLLAKMPHTEEFATQEFLQAWAPRKLSRIQALLEATAKQPYSIEDLQHEGFTLEEILWLAKKGLRRLVQTDMG